MRCWLFGVVLNPESRPVTRVRNIFEPRDLAGASSALWRVRWEHPCFLSALRDWPSLHKVHEVELAPLRGFGDFVPVQHGLEPAFSSLLPLLAGRID